MNEKNDSTQETQPVPPDDITSLLSTSSLENPAVDVKPEVILANAIRRQLLKAEDVYIRPISTFQRSFTKDFFSIERREKENKKPYYYVNVTREGLYDTLPEGVFHQTLKKDAQIDTETAVEELALHRQEEKEARLFFLPLEQEFYRLQMLAEWQESNILLSSLNRQQYDALIELWDLPKGLTTYQTIMMLHIIPMLHRVVGDEKATSNLLSLVMGVSVQVRSHQSTTHQLDEVNLPPLGAFCLGKDSILGNLIEDYHPSYQLIVGPIKKKYITDYLPGGKGRKTLFSLCAFFLPCQSDITMTIEIDQKETGLVLDEAKSGEGYLGYTTFL
uniref:Type VI secretion system baseplate subunit TssG n=1 Tax=Roseihalotalea indica TaxID=2867963 RepID=A0AA49GPY0_9BACT|nr:type VI secretion system baseplate subunit TssG [Tunicatimonas sp. TK19036]